jgi:peptidoglycan/LPS O-acetylase OafA/YrhL
MKVVQVVLLVLHLLGIVALLVGLLVQLRQPEKRVTGPMRDGIGTTFLAGLLLVGVLEARDQDFDHVTVAIMFAIGLAVLVLVMANLRKPSIPGWLYWLILGLTVVNIGVAFG